jgi:hypothetical protein
MERKAFQAVMDAYDNIYSVVGSSQAIDYNKLSQGHGAKYAFNDQVFRMIDFLIDVQNIMKKVLTPNEMEFASDVLNGESSFDWTLQSSSFMLMSEKVGRVFISRKLYPVERYFQVQKKKAA